MFAVLDTETTGLDATRARLIEIAIVGMDAHGGQEFEWSTLVNPGGSSAWGASAIHGIANIDVQGAPTMLDLVPAIARRLRGRCIIAHNAAFDTAVLSQEFARIGLQLPPTPSICTVQVSRSRGLKRLTLASACRSHGLTIDRLHTALGDTRGAARLFAALGGFDLPETSVRVRAASSLAPNWNHFLSALPEPKLSARVD